MSLKLRLSTNKISWKGNKMNLLKTEETAKKVGVCVDHFRKIIKHQPDFPKPIKLTPKAHPKWSEEAIEEYLKKKAA